MRKCEECGVGEDIEMLAHRSGSLVCADCDAELERRWCEETGGRHYLDTFVGAEERDI